MREDSEGVIGIRRKHGRDPPEGYLRGARVLRHQPLAVGDGGVHLRQPVPAGLLCLVSHGRLHQRRRHRDHVALELLLVILGSAMLGRLGDVIFHHLPDIAGKTESAWLCLPAQGLELLRQGEVRLRDVRQRGKVVVRLLLLGQQTGLVDLPLRDGLIDLLESLADVGQRLPGRFDGAALEAPAKLPACAGLLVVGRNLDHGSCPPVRHRVAFSGSIQRILVAGVPAKTGQHRSPGIEPSGRARRACVRACVLSRPRCLPGLVQVGRLLQAGVVADVERVQFSQGRRLLCQVRRRSARTDAGLRDGGSLLAGHDRRLPPLGFLVRGALPRRNVGVLLRDLRITFLSLFLLLVLRRTGVPLLNRADGLHAHTGDGQQGGILRGERGNCCYCFHSLTLA